MRHKTQQSEEMLLILKRRLNYVLWLQDIICTTSEGENNDSVYGVDMYVSCSYLIALDSRLSRDYQQWNWRLGRIPPTKLSTIAKLGVHCYRLVRILRYMRLLTDIQNSTSGRYSVRLRM